MPLAPFRLACALAGGLALFSGAAQADLAGAYLAARSADLAADFAPSRDYLVRALAADPDNPGLLEALAMANVGLGDVAGAIPVARRLAAMGAQAQIARLVLTAERLAGEDHAALLADLDSGTPVAGPLIDPLLRGWAHLGAGSMAQALEEFDKLAATPGLEVFGLYHKGLALALVGDFEGADRLFSDPANSLTATRRAVFAHVRVLSQLDRVADAQLLLDRTFGGVSDPEVDALRARLAPGQPLPFDTVRNARDGMAEVFHVLAIVLQGEAPDHQVLIHSRIAEYLRPDHVDAILFSTSGWSGFSSSARRNSGSARSHSFACSSTTA